MKRTLTAALISVLLATPAKAQTPFVDRIIAGLRADGYVEISVSRTWLGRYRIEAERGGNDREIIVNARTGEVLRDFWELEDDDSGADHD